MEQKEYTLNRAPLIKFQSSEWIHELKEGHLYAKTLSYYRTLDYDEDDTVKDGFDGLLFTPEGYLFIPEKGIVYDISKTSLHTIASEDCVFCMFDAESKNNHFEFTDQQRKKLRSFGDTALVILNRDEFIRRIEKAAKQNGIEEYHRNVQYYNSDKVNQSLLCSLTHNIHNIAFWKRMKYSYQQEWRFVFDTHFNRPDHIDLDIGNISDISIEYPTDTVLKAIIEKEYLKE